MGKSIHFALMDGREKQSKFFEAENVLLQVEF